MLMRTTITARHCEISTTLRTRAQAVLGRLAALADRPVDGTVVFDQAPNAARAEIRLHVSRGDTLVGTSDGKDHRSALDRAEEKVRRQLDKKPAPRQKRRRPLRDAV
jgi:ribosomal subunit interface protein